MVFKHGGSCCQVNKQGCCYRNKSSWPANFKTEGNFQWKPYIHVWPRLEVKLITFGPVYGLICPCNGSNVVANTREQTFSGNIWNTISSVWSWYENMRKWWMSRRGRDVSLILIFLKHDQTRGMNISYSWFHFILMGKLESSYFVCDCGTHYSNGHLVISNKIDRLRS